MVNKVNLIYIGPVGHSGSTLLDLAISASNSVVSVGEVINFDKWVGDDLLCTCSQNISNCGFWKKIREDLGADFSLTKRKPNKFSNYFDIPPLSRSFLKEYNSASFNLFSSVLRNTEATYVLDSSKSLARLKCLVKEKSMNIYFIHLVKDGRIVAKSLTKPKRKLSFKEERYTKKVSFIKSFLSWVLINRQANRFVKKYKHDINYLCIRYEDFIRDPAVELDKVGVFLNVDVSLSMDRQFTLTDCHNIGGSRFRFNNKISIMRKFDAYSLSFFEKVFSNVVGKACLFKYKYL